MGHDKMQGRVNKVVGQKPTIPNCHPHDPNHRKNLIFLANQKME